jgi:hypothetical protein
VFTAPLVHERGGLKRLARLFLRQLLRCQLAQLIVDQRQQMLRGLRIAVLDLLQNLRHFGHGGNDTPDSRPQRLPGSKSSSLG